MSQNGLISTRSQRSAVETIARLEAAVKAAGMSIFACVDHAAGAEAVGLKLRPTTVLIFGNAKAGTPLMQTQQTIGLDLPLKILVWENERGETWLTYNDPHYLAERHGLGAAGSAIIETMSGALRKLAQEAGATG